jgi:hypothetical protein
MSDVERIFGAQNLTLRPDSFVFTISPLAAAAAAAGTDSNFN